MKRSARKRPEVKQPCRYPGCAAIVSSGLCERHQPTARESDKRRGSAARRGYDEAWRKVRAAKLDIDTLCQRCKSLGRIALAREVHHIKPLNQGGERLALENLEALCTACHNARHGGGRRWQ